MGRRWGDSARRRSEFLYGDIAKEQLMPKNFVFTDKRIVISAHIDAKKGSPGAIDNATGVVILLILAELLKDYDGDRSLEIVAFNGEDYYAVPGQMDYISKNQGHFESIVLNINIDGAGYKEGKSAFSFFNLPGGLREVANEMLARFDGITEGSQWPQGDHSIFMRESENE